MGRLVEPGVAAAAATGSGSREPRRPAAGGRAVHTFRAKHAQQRRGLMDGLGGVPWNSGAQIISIHPVTQVQTI